MAGYSSNEEYVGDFQRVFEVGDSCEEYAWDPEEYVGDSYEEYVGDPEEYVW